MTLGRFVSITGGALLLAACPTGEDEPGGGILEGACEGTAIHCVDTTTIQYCSAGVWSEPSECLPEVAGSPPLEVEVNTFCTDDGCRPGG